MVNLPLYIFTNDKSFPLHIQYGFHDKSLYVHGHEDFSELTIVLNGTAEHIVDNEIYPISKGDVFVINNDTQHGFFNTKDFKICNIMFKPSIIWEHNFDIMDTTGFKALFIVEPHYSQKIKFCSHLKLNARQFIFIKDFIDNMILEYNQKEDGWRTLVFSNFIHLIVMLSRWYDLNFKDVGNYLLKISTAINYIEDNYNKKINISTLAKLSGYSERQFVRIFKSTFSMKPITYITNYRMKKARQLINTSNLSIGEIAYLCGYDDNNYFSRVFKNYTGITPTEFRCNNRNSNNI